MKIAPKLKLQALLRATAEGSSSREPGSACKPMSPEEIIEDIYTPEVPGLERSKNPNPTKEKASGTSTVLTNACSSSPRRGDEREPNIENVDVQMPIQGESQPMDSLAVLENPQEETEEMEIKLGEPEIPMRPM